MFIEVVHRPGEDGSGILAEGGRREAVPDEKYLVHADMDHVGVEGLDQLVEQIEDHGMDCGIERVPFPAVDPLVARIGARGEVEFGIAGEQGIGGSGPGLVAETLKLGHQLDVLAPASLGEPFGPGAGDGLTGAAQLGVGLVIEIIVNLEDEHIDARFGEGRQLAFEADETRVRGEAEKVEGAPWFGFFTGGGR
ncbi:MAG: hypothetical protein BWY77_01742 [bacterium ADurb.Bin431]|nr:MAG: hypothetical protein BWY77_01742 [bacterium ADurb.Bin431]